jgi:hypothetical protein
MKVHTLTRFEWCESRKQYVKVLDEWFEYAGPVELTCGATQQQQQIGASQQNFMNQVQQQAGTVFGNSSTVFQDLLNTFTPTVNAGPNQQGFSAQELSNLNSQAITQAGVGYRNAKEAVGNALSAEGGGNVSLPSGTQTGIEASLAENAANQTSTELGQITEQNYAVGRQNYENAVSGLAGAPNVFNPATSTANAATGAGTAAANTANQIAQENNSWVSAVTGALGQVGGAFASGGLSTLLNGATSATQPAPQAPNPNAPYGPNSD